MTRLATRWVALCALLAASCSESPPVERRAGAPSQANFELVCRASNTRERAALFCMRHDTRNGDVVRIDYEKLPVSNGPTAAADGSAGRYQLECESTASDARADVYCIRLDTQTGDMLLIALPKLRVVPAVAEPR